VLASRQDRHAAREASSTTRRELGARAPSVGSQDGEARPMHHRRAVRFAVVVAVLLVIGCSRAAAGAERSPAPDCDAGAEACPVPLDEPTEKWAARSDDEPSGTLLFFWGVGCPVCDEAKPFVDELEGEYPRVTFERIEVKRDQAGRKRFLEKAKELGIASPGVPTFVYADRYVVGYRKGVTEDQVRAMIEGRDPEAADRFVDLPLLGRVEVATVSLPAFTIAVGLLDGINPCALWVLVVLLGILMHAESRGRMLLYGGLFVLTSGVVYFLFMSVWTGVFLVAGLSRALTIALGAAVLAMGLVNLKDTFWLKRGPSLTIPDRVKPRLYRRMRAIARATSWPAAVLGILVLALLVNLVELGCTIGLPAVYTRVLTLRAGLGSAARYAYLALYNVAYIVPLAAAVALFAVSFRRLVLGERAVKALKAVSGALLVVFGLLFLVAPDLLG
jgi:hypothetical protein